MRIDLYVHVDSANEVTAKLDAISKKLDLVIKKETEIMGVVEDALTAAEAAAKNNSDVEDAGEALLVTLSKMIADLKAASTDPATAARITALSDAINSRAAQFGTALAANTPAA
jgi:hypothetical protein